MRRRVSDHVLEHSQLSPFRQTGFGVAGETCAAHALIGDEQDAPGAELGDKPRDLFGRASLKEDVRCGLEGEWVHF